MTDFPLLSILTFVPLVGAVLILAFIRDDDPEVEARNARFTALWTSIAVFLVSLVLWFNFDKTTAEFQWVEKVEWMPAFGISYHMGVDGISVLFVLLTTLLVPICILASWEAIKERVKEYMICFLILETFMIGMFSALDMMLFYIFFEAVLIPMFIIIGIWGGKERVYAAFKMFLYTLLGSVLMLIAMLAMYYDAGTTDMTVLLTHTFPSEMQKWMWLAFFASFAIKVPMWPVHTWLPDAHVQAPTAGSVILAGVLLKFGGYGFLRFSLPMMPEASVYFTPLVYTLSVIAVVYTSLVALAQEDMKKLIAYSSIAHMGFVTIGTFTLNVQGWKARSIRCCRTVSYLPHYSFVWVLSMIACIRAILMLMAGLCIECRHTPSHSWCSPWHPLAYPVRADLVGEVLVLVGAFKANSWVAALAMLGVILGAAYMLFLYRRIIFGELTKENLMKIKDMSRREWAIFAPLLIITIWMGVYPVVFLDFMHVSVENLLNQVQTSLAASTSVQMAGQ